MSGGSEPADCTAVEAFGPVDAAGVLAGLAVSGMVVETVTAFVSSVREYVALCRAVECVFGSEAPALRAIVEPLHPSGRADLDVTVHAGDGDVSVRHFYAVALYPQLRTPALGSARSGGFGEGGGVR